MSNEGNCRTAPATPGLLMSDEGVCRTAPVTTGLLIIHDIYFETLSESKGVL